MPTFSQRNGYTPLPSNMEPETASAELRATFWNYLDATISSRVSLDTVTYMLWAYLYKLPADARPSRPGTYGLSYGPAWEEVRKKILSGPWFTVYDHVEYFVQNFEEIDANVINQILEGECAAYRLVNGQVIQITEQRELDEVRQASESGGKYAAVAAHIQRAVELLSDRRNPDYRNSIKESISAIESVAKVVTGDQKAELGKVLSTLEKKGKINGALKSGFSAIYGWTSDQHGIRHAMTELSSVTQEDAKLFLVMCSAFANYLKAIDLSDASS